MEHNNFTKFFFLLSSKFWKYNHSYPKISIIKLHYSLISLVFWPVLFFKCPVSCGDMSHMIDIWTMVHVNFIAYSKSVRKVISIFFQSNGNINGSQSPPTNSSSNSDCFDNGSEENTFTSLKELSRHLPKGPAEVPNMKHTFHNEYKLNELMKQTGKWFFISLSRNKTDTYVKSCNEFSWSSY